jgi:hypothetical protein
MKKALVGPVVLLLFRALASSKVTTLFVRSIAENGPDTLQNSFNL